MNIALVAIEVHKHGGVPLCVASLVEHLRSRHKVTILTNFVADIDVSGISVYRIPLPSVSRFLRFVLFAVLSNVVLAWLRFCKRAKFDVVHSAGEEGALLSNMVTSHFCQRAELEALHEGVVKLPTRSWRQKVKALDYYLNRRGGCFLEWAVFGRCNKRLRTAVSRQLKEELRRYYGPPAESIIDIPNGVDIEEFHPRLRTEYRSKIRRDCGLSENDFVIFFLGGDWERKGLPQAIETLTLLPDKRIKLLVVGMGDASHYRRLAEQYGVGPRVTFVTRFVKASRYYAAVDLFLLPTICEAFGLVILEAMASGLPALTTASAGVADYLRDGIDCFLVKDFRNIPQMAAKIDVLFNDVGRRQAMGTEARRTAEKLSWAAIVRRYEDKYRTLARGLPG